MEHFLRIQPYTILGFLLAVNLVMLGNLLRLRRMGHYPAARRLPEVAVLVPARNEERNLQACLSSLLAQDYPHFTVWVLDDASTDGTYPIAERLAQGDARLHVLRGQPLPEGWLGKHWACHQLAESSASELLLFTDADTRFHPAALREAVDALTAEQADLLTALPREELGSLGEMLLVPYFLFATLAFVPTFLVYHWKLPAFAFTIGQFMLFRRMAYQQIGGHSAVRADAVDDIALGRATVTAGLRWCMVDGTQRVFCRMYHNFLETWSGFSKNMAAAFGYKFSRFLFVWLWSGVVFLAPLLAVSFGLAGRPWGGYPALVAWVSFGLVITLWSGPYYRLGFPLYLVLAYPLTYLLALAVALRSLFLTTFGRSTWKGRTLTRTKMHWF